MDTSRPGTTGTQTRIWNDPWQICGCFDVEQSLCRCGRERLKNKGLYPTWTCSKCYSPHALYQNSWSVANFDWVQEDQLNPNNILNTLLNLIRLYCRELWISTTYPAGVFFLILLVVWAQFFCVWKMCKDNLLYTNASIVLVKYVHIHTGVEGKTSLGSWLKSIHLSLCNSNLFCK